VLILTTFDRDAEILGAIEAVTSPSDRFEILTATGDPIAVEEWPEKEAYGQTTRFVHRGDFLDALIAELPDGMVKTGYKLVGIVDNGDSATATFENGESVTADLIIGADGIRSRVREQLFSAQQPVFAGEHAYRAVIDVADTHGLPFDDLAGRVASWSRALRESQRLADEFAALVADGRVTKTAGMRNKRG